MCGRYVQAKTVPELVETFGAEDRTSVEGSPVKLLQPSWNVAPGKVVPVVLTHERRELRALRWGLVPSWAKDPAIGSRMINARAETLGDKPSFRRALAQRRCLVPADGWYEWMALPPGPDGKPRKQPFWLSPPEGGQLALAGLYEHWRAGPQEPWLSTFTVITTEASDELRHVHDRMPVVLAPADWECWLDPGSTSALVLPLLVPAAPGQIRAFPVSSRVGSVRNDGPDLIEPLPLG